jgi:UDP-N-acetylmuramoyl-tripeptide--D-alanyl-D-alanine ligase
VNNKNNKKEILWTSEAAAKVTGGETTHDFAVTGIASDVHMLKEAQAFIALKNDEHDGHKDVEAAFRAGAVAAIVSKTFKPKDPHWPLLQVDDTGKALEALAAVARNHAKATVIGVTGSAGKSGATEMLAIMLGAMGKTHASSGNSGALLALANLPADAKYGVFEMGMHNKGEMAALTRIVRPHVALVTTIEPKHLERFKTVEAIADAEAEIYQGMDAKGIVVLNHDNPHFTRLKNTAEKAGLRKVYGFGEDDGAQSRLVDCTLHADSSRVTADILGERVKYKLAIPGKHIVLNSLGALAVVKAVAGELSKPVEALKNSTPIEGRGNRILVTLEAGKPPLTIIDESYNATPESMLAALRVFELSHPANGGRRIAVFGDMLELGKDGPRQHAQLANPLLKAKTDLLYCCGPQMDALYQALPPDWRGAHTDDSKSLASKLIDIVRPGDVLLIKGSSGNKMGYIIHALQALQPTQAKAKDQRNAV